MLLGITFFFLVWKQRGFENIFPPFQVISDYSFIFAFMYVKYDTGLVQSGDPLSLVELKFISFSVI